MQCKQFQLLKMGGILATKRKDLTEEKWYIMTAPVRMGSEYTLHTWKAPDTSQAYLYIPITNKITFESLLYMFVSFFLNIFFLTHIRVCEEIMSILLY